jgi:regulatory protein
MNDIVSLDAVRRERSAAAHGVEAGPAPASETDEERLARVSDTVVRALGRRQLSAAETVELLVAQGAEPDEAEVIVARYRELGYVDDRMLAEALVERLRARSGKSRAVIARELAARRIPSDIVSEALDVVDDVEERELAEAAALKRVRQLSSYDDETAERRLMGFLARRGYPSPVVREAVRAAMATRTERRGPRFV